MSHDVVRRIIANVENAVLGKQQTIKLSVVALLAGGHILLEDAPGLGKTSLARALSKTLGCKFVRMQFTPDLLPSDILGSSVYRPGTGDFEFRPGPIFTNILLADEINRTTPRNQSALLEAMSERQVSVDGITHKLQEPFLVIATQNPYEFEGTYPLPENQLDRFMMCLSVGYPDRKSELEILQKHRTGQPVDECRRSFAASEAGSGRHRGYVTGRIHAGVVCPDAIAQRTDTRREYSRNSDVVPSRSGRGILRRTQLRDSR